MPRHVTRCYLPPPDASIIVTTRLRVDASARHTLFVTRGDYAALRVVALFAIVTSAALLALFAILSYCCDDDARRALRGARYIGFTI